VAELCYKTLFSTIYDKVLMKQTRKSEYLHFADQKLTVNSEYIAY